MGKMKNIDTEIITSKLSDLINTIDTFIDSREPEERQIAKQAMDELMSRKSWQLLLGDNQKELIRVVEKLAEDKGVNTFFH